MSKDINKDISKDSNIYQPGIRRYSIKLKLFHPWLSISCISYKETLQDIVDKAKDGESLLC